MDGFYSPNVPTYATGGHGLLQGILSDSSTLLKLANTWCSWICLHFFLLSVHTLRFTS